MQKDWLRAYIRFYADAEQILAHGEATRGMRIEPRPCVDDGQGRKACGTTERKVMADKTAERVADEMAP